MAVWPLSDLIKSVVANVRAMRVQIAGDDGTPVDVATETKQDTLIAKDFATQTTLAAVLAKQSADPATATKQDALIAKDFATESTMASQLNITLTALRDAITDSGLDAKTLNDLHILLNAIKTAVEGTVNVDVTASALPTGAATSAKQDTLIAKDYATQTTLAAQLDITISALRDAITASGASAKTLNDLYGRLDAVKTAVEGTLTTDSTVQNWPTKQQVNLSQDGTDNKVDVDFPASQTVDGTVGVNSLPALPAGTNKIGKVDVDNFPTSIEVENPTGESLDVQVTGSNAANYESVTVANSAIGLTAGTYGTNIYALITVETAQIRFRIDGTDPTASEGHVLNPGDILRLNSNADIAAFKAIRTGSVSGVIKATYSGVA